MKGLYRGFGITVIGSAPATCLYLTSYDAAKTSLSSNVFAGNDGQGTLSSTGVVKVMILNVNEVCTMVSVERKVPEHTKNNQLDSLTGYNSATPTNVGDLCHC